MLVQANATRTAGVDPCALPQAVRLALVERAALKCLLAGYRRIALFGAGRHTRRLGLDPWTSRGLEVVAILDHCPPAETLLGVPVRLPEALEERVDAIVLSSDAHEAALAAAAASEPALAGIPVVRVYDLPAPPGPPIAPRPRPVRRTTRAEIERLLAADLERLNFGCGEHPLPGWTNIDGGDGQWYQPPDGAQIIALDAFEALRALPDRCARFIASEHFFEHFSLQDGHELLAEWFRVLRPGGVVRICAPDLEKNARMYLRDIQPAPDELIERHQIGWLGERYVLRPGERLTPAIVHNHSMWLDGHRFVYDFQTISQSLALAGFRGVVRGRYGESRHVALRGIERHDGGETGRSWIPSMALVVEASRHG